MTFLVDIETQLLFKDIVFENWDRDVFPLNIEIPKIDEHEPKTSFDHS